MALTADQILAAQKANLETLFGLTTKAFEGVEKLVELAHAAAVVHHHAVQRNALLAREARLQRHHIILVVRATSTERLPSGASSGTSKHSR